MSTENRLALHAELVGQIRRFIAGTILFNQKVDQGLTQQECRLPVSIGGVQSWAS